MGFQEMTKRMRASVSTRRNKFRHRNADLPLINDPENSAPRLVDGEGDCADFSRRSEQQGFNQRPNEQRLAAEAEKIQGKDVNVEERDTRSTFRDDSNDFQVVHPGSPSQSYHSHQAIRSESSSVVTHRSDEGRDAMGAHTPSIDVEAQPSSNTLYSNTTLHSTADTKTASDVAIREVENSDVPHKALKAAQRIQDADSAGDCGPNEVVEDSSDSRVNEQNANSLDEDKTQKLEIRNRSMFAVHANESFTAHSRRDERDRREASTEPMPHNRTQTKHRNVKEFSDTEKPLPGAGKLGLAGRAKYHFEADSEDDQMEDEIDDNLEQLSPTRSLVARLSAHSLGQSDRFDDRLCSNYPVELAASNTWRMTVASEQPRGDVTRPPRLSRIH